MSYKALSAKSFKQHTCTQFWKKSNNNNNHVARTSIKVRASRTPKYKSRVVRRCKLCGRKHGYMRDFDICRICFRELAHEGHIPGITKSSW